MPAQVLSLESLNKLVRLEANSNFRSITPILVGDLPSLQKDGELVVRMPGQSEGIVFNTTDVISEIDGDFEWYGQMKGEAASYAILKRENGETFGNIVHDSKSYLIQSLIDGYSLLLEEDMDHQPTEGCPSFEIDSKFKDISAYDNKDAGDCDPQTIVRVTVLYTAAANAVQANMSQYVGTLMAAANNTLFNSDINFNDLRFESAGVQELVGYVEEQTITAEVLELEDRGETAGSFVEQQRDALGGDLVILLTDGAYGAAGGAFEQVGLEERAYGVVQVDFPTARNSFAHEIGHLLGARHDTDIGVTPSANQGNIGTFAAGMRFFTGGTERWTTMAEFPSNNTRIPNFSNPNVNFQGVPTGVVDDRDNARQIRDNGACIVSCYREPYQPPMEVIITGFDQSPPGTTNTWCTTVANCANVTNFDWEYSYNGFNYTSFFGGSCATRTMPASGVNTVWLRVTATCADGQTDTDIHRINVGSAGGGGGPIPLVDGNFDTYQNVATHEQELEASIYPNPALGKVNLTYTLPAASAVQVKLRSQNGAEVASFVHKKQNPGKHSLQIARNLKPGIYFFQVQTERGNVTKKIIVL